MVHTPSPVKKTTQGSCKFSASISGIPLCACAGCSGSHSQEDAFTALRGIRSVPAFEDVAKAACAVLTYPGFVGGP